MTVSWSEMTWVYAQVLSEWMLTDCFRIAALPLRECYWVYSFHSVLIIKTKAKKKACVRSEQTPFLTSASSRATATGKAVNVPAVAASRAFHVKDSPVGKIGKRLSSWPLGSISTPLAQLDLHILGANFYCSSFLIFTEHHGPPSGTNSARQSPALPHRPVGQSQANHLPGDRWGYCFWVSSLCSPLPTHISHMVRQESTWGHNMLLVPPEMPPLLAPSGSFSERTCIPLCGDSPWEKEESSLGPLGFGEGSLRPHALMSTAMFAWISLLFW